MDRDQPALSSLAERRLYFADELRVVADLSSVRLVQAFGSVAREHFLGPPPWRYAARMSFRPATYRTTEDPADLYHDIFVALKSESFLNNGQPSLVAQCIGQLNLVPGSRVLHVGCGSGYYTAIMAEVVGPGGSILAVEIDPDLAQFAAANLAAYSQVTVLQQDAAGLNPGPVDAVLVSAAVTHPGLHWIGSLEVGGSLVLPLRVGPSPAANDALVVSITRKERDFALELVSITSFFPSRSLFDPELQRILHAALESRAILHARWFRLDPHEPGPDCQAHTPAFCLSSVPGSGRPR